MRGGVKDFKLEGLLSDRPPGRPLPFRKRGTEALGDLDSQERDEEAVDGETAGEMGEGGKGEG